MGGYLGWEARHGRGRRRARRPGGRAGGEGQYLPDASIWPFGIGMGAVLMVNGLALGVWAVLPGAAVTALSTVGFARQSAPQRTVGAADGDVGRAAVGGGPVRCVADEAAARLTPDGGPSARRSSSRHSR